MCPGLSAPKPHVFNDFGGIVAMTTAGVSNSVILSMIDRDQPVFVLSHSQLAPKPGCYR